MLRKFGPSAEDHYAGRKPEFITMSRRPGIGHRWIEMYKSDVYPYDEVVIRGGKRCKPPRYYDNFLCLTDPEAYAKLKASREIPESVPDSRLADIELCKQAICKTQLLRRYEA